MRGTRNIGLVAFDAPADRASAGRTRFDRAVGRPEALGGRQTRLAVASRHRAVYTRLHASSGNLTLHHPPRARGVLSAGKKPAGGVIRISKILLINLLLILALAEIGFRLYDWFNPSFVFYKDSYNRYRGAPGRRIGISNSMPKASRTWRSRLNGMGYIESSGWETRSRSAWCPMRRTT